MSSLNGSGGVVNLGSAALTIQNAGIDVYSGTIQGTGSLTKTGTGTQTLFGNNSYTGGTNLAGGVLSVSSDSNLGAASGPLTFNGGTLRTLASFSTGRAITLNAAGGTFEPAADTTLTESGPIAGAGRLAKTGPGTLILGGNNTYSGRDALECRHAGGEQRTGVGARQCSRQWRSSES